MLDAIRATDGPIQAIVHGAGVEKSRAFISKTLAELARRFRPLVRPTSPFVDPPREHGVTWIGPELVAQIGFMERTADGRLRHPVFLGLRDDKAADEVRWASQTA